MIILAPSSKLTRRERGRIDRLRDRATVLRARLAAGLCAKLDGEVAELSALDWAVGVLTAQKVVT